MLDQAHELDHLCCVHEVSAKVIHCRHIITALDTAEEVSSCSPHGLLALTGSNSIRANQKTIQQHFETFDGAQVAMQPSANQSSHSAITS